MSDPRRLLALRSVDGQSAWERTVRGDDALVFGEQFLAWLSRAEPALLAEPRHRRGCGVRIWPVRMRGLVGC